MQSAGILFNISVISSILLIINFIQINGEEVKFSNCQKFQRDKDGVARQYEQSCTVNKVVVDPCPEAANNEPCKLKHGRNGSIKFDFTPQFSATNVTSIPYWDQALMHVPFDEMDKNGCNYMKCPMEKDVPSSFSYGLNIKSTYPADVYTVKWKLQNAEDPSKECCFRFRIKIVP